MKPRSPRERRRMASSSLVATALLTAALAPAAGAATTPTARAAAAGGYHRADAAVVRAAHRLAACQHRAIRCAAQRHALQRAGRRFSAAQAVVAHQASIRSASDLTGTRRAPELRVAGARLVWQRVAGVGDYVLVSKVTGHADRYSVVSGTTTTPAAVPGRTVTYGVRTAVVGSAWARAAQIRYATAAQRRARPTLTVDGQTLRWNRVAGLDDYFLVTKVPGSADAYTRVAGTSTVPAAHPGQTVHFSVRTAVDGSAWAAERAIAYPAAAAPAPASAPVTTPVADPRTTPPASTPVPPATSPAPAPTTNAPAPAPSTSATFRTGIVSGAAVNWELPFVKQLGAHAARMEFDIETPAADLAPYVDAYAKAGIQPLLLAGFQGHMPTAAQARNLATWAAAYGPGGTFWAGKGYAASTAVTSIEFGNESNQAWQYPTLAGDPDWAKTAFYADLATQYALRFRDAREAMRTANPDVGLLAIGDTPGNWSTWMDNAFRAVPEFASLVSGWVVHPYGPASRWQPIVDNAIAQTAAHGAPSTIPLYVTEYGVASDDGRCLDDNYGWNTCMTYDQAAGALTSSIAAMRSRYGSRLRAVYLYQAHDQKNPTTSTGREGYFGGLTLSGAVKGAYTTAVKDLLAAG
jgi:hypothetical protein